MRLSFEQLDEFVVGCESTEVMAQAWRVHRLPQQLRAVYDAPSRFAVRRDCPSSVRLRFRTDSLRIRLSMQFGDAAHPVYQGSVIIDGTAPGSFGPLQPISEWRGDILHEKDSAFHTIDIWLPHLCNLNELAIELDDDASISTAPLLPVRWLAYGDSITQGFCASHPTQSLVGRCALALNAAVHNLGVGGSMLHAALADTIPEGGFNLISIAYGVCDFQEDVPLDSLQRNATRLINALQRAQPGCPIVVITPISWNAADRLNGLGLAIRHYRDALCAAADNRKGVLVVDGSCLVPNNPALFEDWVHPNDSGFEVYALNLLPHLRRALEGQA